MKEQNWPMAIKRLLLLVWTVGGVLLTCVGAVAMFEKSQMLGGVAVFVGFAAAVVAGIWAINWVFAGLAMPRK